MLRTKTPSSSGIVKMYGKVVLEANWNGIIKDGGQNLSLCVHRTAVANSTTSIGVKGLWKLLTYSCLYPCPSWQVNIMRRPVPVWSFSHTINPLDLFPPNFEKQMPSLCSAFRSLLLHHCEFNILRLI